MNELNENNQRKTVLREDPTVYQSREALERARLLEAINRTDAEKFRVFTRMMRINLMLKKAKITHKTDY